MFNSIFGLPLHPLVVHATVVVVPAAAAAVGLAAAIPRFRRWAGWLPLALSIVGVLLIPVTTSSGESLEHRLPHSDLIEEHARLADGLLPWVIVLVVAAAALYWIQLAETGASIPLIGSDRSARLAARVPQRDRGAVHRPVLLAVCAIAAIGVIGTGVQVARIGHSGAKAAWSDVPASSAPQGSGG